MDVVYVLGESGRKYRAYDTGMAWNGNPVIGFDSVELEAIILNGDDPAMRIGFLGTFEDEYMGVPSTWFFYGSRALFLYVPEGRAWDTCELGYQDYDAYLDAEVFV